MKEEQGFTLLEVIIAMAISVVVIMVTYATYSTQQRAFVAQRQIAEIQQNLRASMYLLEVGIKSAGYDPTESGFARILNADSVAFQFEADINGNRNDFGLVGPALNPVDPNADPNERVRFGLSNDVDGNGIANDFPCVLERQTWAGTSFAMADNIEVLNFVYLNGNGNVLGPLPLNATNRDNIRTIQVTIVVRSERGDPRHMDRGVADPLNPGNPSGYFNLQNQLILPVPNDNFYRRVMSRSIDCPNIL